MATIYGDGYTCTFKPWDGSRMSSACKCHATGATYTFAAGYYMDDETWAKFIANNIKYDCPPTVQPKAEGKIIAFNINGLPGPGCGEAKEGEEIEVMLGMKNIGDVEGKFRFYIYNQYGDELSKEPDYSYKNIKAGDTWGIQKTFTANLNFEMINKALNGKVVLKRQT